MADLGIYISHTTCELRWYDKKGISNQELISFLKKYHAKYGLDEKFKSHIDNVREFP